MFRKVKYDNGKREIYFGKKKIFQYLRQSQFADFVENKFNNIAHSLTLTLPLKTANIVYDANKMSVNMGGGGSFYSFEFLLNRAYVAQKYHKIFYDFYLRNKNGEQLVFVDGGCHNGVFSDIALACGGICYAFEPNVYLCAFLRNLYKDNPHFILHQQAISNKNDKTIFYDMPDDVVSQGASIIKFGASDYANTQIQGYEVQMIDFSEFVKGLLQKHGKINLIKLDIEGAEFDVLDAFIEQNLHENIEYIMVETHERVFDNPTEKIKTLQNKIAQKNISNIYLDWI